MIIESLAECWITVNDISLKLPPRGKGCVSVDVVSAGKSDELVELARMGLVKFSGEDEAIREGTVDGKHATLMRGHNVWGGEKTKKVDFISQRKADILEVLTDIRRGSAHPEKRYLIENIGGCMLTLNAANISLNKERTAAWLTEEQYHHQQVQELLQFKQIRLVQAEEQEIDSGGTTKWNKLAVEDHVVPPITFSKDSPCCFWEGPIFDAGGYANMNRNYCWHLSDMGVRVKPSMVSTLMDVETEVQERIVEMSRICIGYDSPKVFATNIPKKHSGHCVAYTMMETETKIHPLLASHMQVADELWVPCEWNKRTFGNVLKDRPIHVMPLGVDEKMYLPGEQDVFFDCGTKGFTFISVFNWNWRKGFDVMLKAYARAFSGNDDVSLVMVSRFVGQTKLSARIYEDIRKYMAGERSTNLPHLVLVDEVIPTNMMPRIYHSADAFVLFSRGEGWGLPASEAGVSGVPLLVSDHGGHEMFLSPTTAMLVKPDRVCKVDRSIEWISPFYGGQDFVDYSDKAVGEIAEKMRWMYANRDKLAPMAWRCRQNMLNNFTWRHAAARVKARLQEIG